MSWYALAVVHVLGIAMYGIAQRWALRDDKYLPIPFAIATLFVAGMTSLIFAIITGEYDFNYTSLPPLALLVSLASNTFNITLASKALKLIEISIFSIITNTRVLFMVGLSAIFLDDPLTLQNIAGTLLVLIGASIVVYEPGTRFRLNKGIIYALAATVAIGVPFVSDVYSLRDGFNPASYLALIWLFPFTIISITRRSDFMTLTSYVKKRDFMKKAIAPGVLLAIGVIAILEAVQIADNPAVLSIISQLATILVVIMSIIFLGERKQLKLKFIAALIAFSGLVLISI